MYMSDLWARRQAHATTCSLVWRLSKPPAAVRGVALHYSELIYFTIQFLHAAGRWPGSIDLIVWVVHCPVRAFQSGLTLPNMY